MIEQIAWVADKNTILVFIWGGVNIFDKKVTHPNELFKASFEEYNLLKKNISLETFKEFWRLSEIFKEFQRFSEMFIDLQRFSEIIKNVRRLSENLKKLLNSTLDESSLKCKNSYYCKTRLFVGFWNTVYPK